MVRRDGGDGNWVVVVVVVVAGGPAPAAADRVGSLVLVVVLLGWVWPEVVVAVRIVAVLPLP